MKILLTGLTGRQKGKQLKKNRSGRAIDSNYIYKALKDMGHAVQFREIHPGEDLNKFDKIIFGVIDLSGVYGRSCILPMQQMADVPKEKVIIFYEDWKLSKMKEVYHRFTKASREENIAHIIGRNPRFYDIAEEDFDVDKFLKMVTALENGEYNIMIPSFKWGDKEIYRKHMPFKKVFPIDLSPYFIEDFGLVNEPFDEEKFKKKIDKHILNKLGKISNAELKRMGVTAEECDIFNGSIRSKDMKFDTEYDVFLNTTRYKSIIIPKYNHNGSGHFRSRWIFAAYGNGYVISETDNKDFEMLGIPNINILKLPIDEQIKHVKLLKEKIVENLSSKEDVMNIIEQALNEGA
jgi:hypothetical protein